MSIEEGVFADKLYKFVTMKTMPILGLGIGAVFGYFIAVLVNVSFEITEDTSKLIGCACIWAGSLVVAFVLSRTDSTKLLRKR